MARLLSLELQSVCEGLLVGANKVGQILLGSRVRFWDKARYRVAQ